MSIAIVSSTMDNAVRKKINKELPIKIENKYNPNAPPQWVIPFLDDGETTVIPFSYGARVLKIPRPLRKRFTETRLKFEGSLREEQLVVRNEAADIISKKGSVMISAFCGFGKCLGFGTPVMMSDGSIKQVQDIEAGEQIMGDDSTPRNVLSTCRGEEQMYRVNPIKGDSFTANESHILSLKISTNRTVIHNKAAGVYIAKCFNHITRRFEHRHYTEEAAARKYVDEYDSPNTIDIQIDEYMALRRGTQSSLLLYRVPIEFPKQEVEIDPYLLGIWLGDGTMTTSIITTADPEVVAYLKRYCDEHGFRLHQGKIGPLGARNDLNYRINDDSCRGNRFLTYLDKYSLRESKRIPPRYLRNDRETRLQMLAGLIDSDGYYVKGCYEITQKCKDLTDDIVYLARSLGFAAYAKDVEKSCIYKGEKRFGNYRRVGIHGIGLQDIPCLIPRKQAVVRKQVKDVLCTNFTLDPVPERNYYGFSIDGNRRFVLGDFTVTHNTCTAVNLAVAIGFRTLIIVHAVPLMVQWEKAINKFCPTAVVRRVTAKSPFKPGDFYIINAQNAEKKGHEFFADVGLTIVDEAHKIMAATMSRALQYVQPRYLIGLSATPYRPDGLDKLLTLYFGTHPKIYRKLWREHTAYKILTGVQPKLEKTITGKLNWNVVLDSLCQDTARNELIVKIIMSHPTRNFLVLTKRLHQGDYLEQRLTSSGVSVTSLMRDNQEYDVDARVLIGTVGKIGTGFDHPYLDALLLASDVEQYFIQILGRVFRRKDVIPLIFDLVDSHRTLEKHYNTRAATYIEHGGTIVNYAKQKLK